MTELKITKERILEAAAKCSTAKVTLQVLFPEAFVDEHEKIWNELGKQIGKLINDNDSPYTIYRAIPGQESPDKGKWIVDLIRKELKIQ